MKQLDLFVLALASLLTFSAHGQPASPYTPCQSDNAAGTSVEVFDWRAPAFDAYIQGWPGRTEIVSPFWPSPPELPQENVAHLAVFPQDFEPADGWELLARGLGTPEFPTSLPFLVFYNRYSGRMRVLLYSKLDIGTFRSAMIHLSLFGGSTHFNSRLATFEQGIVPMRALDNFEPGLEWRFLNHYYNHPTSDPGRTWLLGEAPIAYDPCACSYTVAFHIQQWFEREPDGKWVPGSAILIKVPGTMPLPFSWVPGFEPEEPYDSPLGVMNLLETPQVLLARGFRQDRVRQSWKLDAASVQYIVNEAAGLEIEPRTVRAALVFDCGEEGLLEPVAGLTRTADGTYATPFMPIECLGEYAIEQEMPFPEGFRPFSCAVYLRLETSVRSLVSDQKEFPFTALYRVRLLPAPYDVYATPLNPYLGMDSDDFSAAPPCGYTLPASPQAIADFCRNQHGSPPAFGDELSLLDSGTPQTKVFPLPVSNALNIHLPSGYDLALATLRDMYGRPILRQALVSAQESLDVAALPAGMYVLQLEFGEGIPLQVHKIIKH
jgi:hypothetical protein